MGSRSVFRVALHQTSHLGQHDGADGILGTVADGRAEGNPRTDVAQRGHEHLKVGGEPPAVLLRATQAGERVAESCGREDAAHHNRDDGEVRSQPHEKVHIRRPPPERLNRAWHHCRVRLPSPGGREIYYMERLMCRGSTSVEAFVYPSPPPGGASGPHQPWRSGPSGAAARVARSSSGPRRPSV